MRVHRLKFIDLPGTWQHYTLPIKELAIYSKTVTALTARPFVVSAQFMRAICCFSADPTTAIVDPVLSPST